MDTNTCHIYQLSLNKIISYNHHKLREKKTYAKGNCEIIKPKHPILKFGCYD